MLHRLYNILNATYQHKITFSAPLVVPCKPVQVIHSITKLPCGYSALVEVAGNKTPVHINKLRAEAVAALVQHLVPVSVTVHDKVGAAWVSVHSQMFL